MIICQLLSSKYCAVSVICICAWRSVFVMLYTLEDKQGQLKVLVSLVYIDSAVAHQSSLFEGSLEASINSLCRVILVLKLERIVSLHCKALYQNRYSLSLT